MQDVDNWPRIVQLAWAVFNDEGTLVRGKQYIIQPDGWTIPQEASRFMALPKELPSATEFHCSAP